MSRKLSVHGRKLARQERVRAGSAPTQLSPALCSPVGQATANHLAARQLVEFDAYMRTISLKVYLTDEGEPAAQLLASLAFALSMGANIGLNLAPDCANTKRMHAALRTVVQLSVDGGCWNAAQARVLHEAAELAKDAFLAHPRDGIDVYDSAVYLSSRVARGTARLSDVAGSEVYKAPPTL